MVPIKTFSGTARFLAANAACPTVNGTHSRLGTAADDHRATIGMLLIRDICLPGINTFQLTHGSQAVLQAVIMTGGAILQQLDTYHV